MRLGSNSKIDLIKGVPLFSSASKQELGEIASIADEIDLPEGKVLIKEGDTGREFFVLIDGTAEVARAGEPSPETEPDAAVAHEVGDLLFTVVNLARRLNVDPELALRATNTRFVTPPVEVITTVAITCGWSSSTSTCLTVAASRGGAETSANSRVICASASVVACSAPSTSAPGPLRSSATDAGRGSRRSRRPSTKSR